MQLSKDQLDKLLAANLQNIVAKVKAGKTLSKAERELFEEYSGTETPTGETCKNITALAKRLGITTRTIHRWKKQYPDAPKTMRVSDWVAFQTLVSGVGRESEQYAARRAKAQAEREELAVEKLQLEIAQIKKELQPRTDVYADGQRIGQTIRSAFSRLERDLAARLEGLTPEARRVAVREALAETIKDINEALKPLEEK